MKPLSITWVTLVGFVCVPLSSLGFFAHIRAGDAPMIVTPGPAVIFAVATTLLIRPGLVMRHPRVNKDTWIDAIDATRVAVFARVSAIAGSVPVDVLTDVMTVSLTQLEASAMVANAIALGLNGLVGLVRTVVALVVERWCMINSDGDGSSSLHKCSVAVQAPCMGVLSRARVNPP